MHRLSCVGRLTAIERGVQGLQLVDLEHAPLERGEHFMSLEYREIEQGIPEVWNVAPS